MTDTSTADKSDARTYVAQWCAELAQIAETILGYPAALMSAAEWREVGWTMWPDFIAPEQVQSLHKLSTWLTAIVPLVEKCAGKPVAEMSIADWSEALQTTRADLLLTRS
jgi:hypothetical protein